MTTQLSLPHALVEAARIAAPVFQAEQWMYVTDEGGDTSHIPLEGEIAEAIHRRVIEAAERGESTGGRFLVKSTPVGTDVYLRVGTHALAAQSGPLQGGQVGSY